MKILIFGIGGIGGFVGGALARVADSIYFYSRGENGRTIGEKGIQVDSALLGSFTAHPVKVSHEAGEMGPMDLVFLSCKGNGLKEACRELAPMVTKDTVVVPLLNGVLVSELMEPLLPACHVADGTIRVFSHREGPGHVVQTAGSGKIVMGMKDGKNPPALYEAADLLQKAGIPAEVTGDIRLDSWEKYALMGSNSAVFCYFDGPAGKVRQQKDYLSILHEAVGEVMAVAKAKGVSFPVEYEENYIRIFRSLPDDTVTSLYRDLSGGKKAEDTEAAMILGRMVDMGKETGVEVPVFRRAWEWAMKQNRK